MTKLETLQKKIASLLNEVHQIQRVEVLVGSRRPQYTWAGRELIAKENIPEDFVQAMQDNSEVFLIRDAGGNPYSLVLADFSGTFRERVFSVKEIQNA